MCRIKKIYRRDTYGNSSRTSFTKEILARAAKAFHVTVEEKPLGDFENYIFKAKGDNDEDYVLRLTHSSHRSKQEVEAELDFYDMLRETGQR